MCVRHQKVGCFCKQDDLFRRAADLCAPADLSRPHQICADHTMRFVEVRKLVHFTKFLPPKRGFCPVGNLHPAKKLCNFFSSSWSPDIDGIRWQNSSGADSRLIVPLPRRPLSLQQQVTHIHPSHIFEQAYMKIHSGKKSKKV